MDDLARVRGLLVDRLALWLHVADERSVASPSEGGAFRFMNAPLVERKPRSDRVIDVGRIVGPGVRRRGAHRVPTESRRSGEPRELEGIRVLRRRCPCLGRLEALPKPIRSGIGIGRRLRKAARWSPKYPEKVDESRAAIPGAPTGPCSVARSIGSITARKAFWPAIRGRNDRLCLNP